MEEPIVDRVLVVGRRDIKNAKVWEQRTFGGPAGGECSKDRRLAYNIALTTVRKQRTKLLDTLDARSVVFDALDLVLG